MRYSLAVAVVPLVMALAPPAMAFDCGRASTIVEKAICAEPALKSLDARMEAAYAEAKSLSSKPEQKMLARSQKAWIAERETGCASAGCRIEFLYREVDPGAPRPARRAAGERTWKRWPDHSRVHRAGGNRDPV